MNRELDSGDEVMHRPISDMRFSKKNAVDGRTCAQM